MKVSYGLLTAAQAGLIVLCGFSVLDYGVLLAQFDEDGDALWFNKFFFDEEEGIIKGTPLEDNDFYGVFHFWGFLMMIVGVIQAYKAAAFWGRWEIG